MNPLDPLDYYDFWFGDGADFTWGDLLTYDFWQLGGTTSFFSTPKKAHDWVSKHIWEKYSGFDGLPDESDWRRFMIALSDDARQSAESVGYWSGATGYEKARAYWQQMDRYTWQVLQPSEHPELKNWFNESLDIAERTVDYDEGGILNPNPEGAPDTARLPFWVLGLGVGMVYLWSKK